jgi:hypothetical protein
VNRCQDEAPSTHDLAALHPIRVLREHRHHRLELRLQLGHGKPEPDALVFRNNAGAPMSRYEAKPGTGHSRSPLKQHEQWLLELVAEEPDLTLHEIRARLRSEKKMKAA